MAKGVKRERRKDETTLTGRRERKFREEREKQEKERERERKKLCPNNCLTGFSLFFFPSPSQTCIKLDSGDDEKERYVGSEDDYLFFLHIFSLCTLLNSLCPRVWQEH